MKRQFSLFLSLFVLLFLVQTAEAGWQDDLKKQADSFKKKVSASTPTLKSATTKVTNCNALSCDVVFRFVIYNPNNLSISNVVVDYRMIIEGNTMGTGTMTPTIKKKANSTIDIVLNVTYENLFKAAQTLMKAIFMGQKDIPYQLDFKAKIKVASYTFNLPHTVKGQIQLPNR